jgi:plastocyanin
VILMSNSKRNRTAAVVTGGLAVLAVGALPLTGAAANDGATAAGKPKTYKTKVLDDYYTPTSLTIKKGDTIKYKWGDNGNPHNVTLDEGPSSLSSKEKKKFKSATGAIGIKFNPVFKEKGTYKFICTIHPGTMQQTVKVKK